MVSKTVMVYKTDPAPMALSGFTLLEVMVALAVVAIALAALVSGAAFTLRTQSQLTTQTLASWVASNQLARFASIRNAARQGQEQLAGQSWAWEITTSTTSEPRLQKAMITVFEPSTSTTSATPVYRRVTFVLEP